MGRRAIQQVVGREVVWLEVLEPAIEIFVAFGLYLTGGLWYKSLYYTCGSTQNIILAVLKKAKVHLEDGPLYKSPHCTSASSRSSGSAPLPLPSPPLQRLSLQKLFHFVNASPESKLFDAV